MKQVVGTYNTHSASSGWNRPCALPPTPQSFTITSYIPLSCQSMQVTHRQKINSDTVVNTDLIPVAPSGAQGIRETLRFTSVS
jgi:hypothetical protein